MAGAALFSKTGVGTLASHKAEGPFLKTFIKDLKDKQRRHEEYAEWVAESFHALHDEFGELSWDNRLMIVVPDEDFRQRIEPQLEASLQRVITKVGAARSIKLVSANEASAQFRTRHDAVVDRIVLTAIGDAGEARVS